MRILVLQESDWIERGPHQSHHLFERLQQRGHSIRVVDFDIGWRERPRSVILSRRKTLHAPPKVIEGSDIEVVRPSMLAIPVLDYVSAFVMHRLEILRQTKEFRPDVIVGLGILNASSGIRVARDEGIPFVYYLIDELHQLVPQRAFLGLARVLEQHNVRHASRVLAINQALRDYAVHMGAAAERTQVLPAGIDLDRYSAGGNGPLVRMQLGLQPDDLVMFFMGWIYPFSGIREVAEKVISGERRDVKLLLVGKGDIWGDLAALAKKDGAMDRIKMVGFRPYAEMPGLLAAASVCLLPALPVQTMLNIVPIKMYEYLAAGKPVIATELPGLVKEFGRGHGVVYVRSPGEVISKALELKKADQLKTLGQQGRTFVSKNDWNSITDHFEAYLKDLVEASGRTTGNA